KDYIATPKLNGYKSLHTTVLVDKRKAVEIQIRTEEMDEFNEYGIASHWYYKKGATPKLEQLDWLKKLMDVHDEKMSTADYYQTVRDEILKDEMFIFTPKGDVFELPKNSTPLDFAYRIHTEVGHRCKGARVNGNIVPLNYQLKNGMIVEIITGKEDNPKEAWLSIVKTSNARKKIKHYFVLKQQEEEAQKRSEPTTVKEKKVEQKEIKVEEKFYPKQFNDSAKITIEVDGEKNLLFSFARCCNPAPSDKIVGFVSRGRGIIIHREDCRNLTSMKDYKERLIEVNWFYKAKNKIYKFIIKVGIKSNPFGDIGSIVQKYEGRILDTFLETPVDESQIKIEGYFILELPNSVNPSYLVKQLKKIPNILSIEMKNEK
ncbi:MAG TPA: TGS domain-containing protein, partial [Spirochaetota bacterium]|nr:TGS domain-containing protein [Spirochaetota bacterium]